MTKKERLLASLRGEPVDRPAVSFHEVNGYRQNLDDPDPYNVHNDPSWRPLAQLAFEKSDCIVLGGPGGKSVTHNPVDERTKWESWDENDRRYFRKTIRANDRVLTCLMRRDAEVNTTWTLEHMLKDADDLKAWLDIPECHEHRFEIDPSGILALEERMGDNGIAMLDTSDGVCNVAGLFDMGTWTVMAMTEQDLVTQAIEREHRRQLAWVKAACAALPGRPWRIYGPEYAIEPYMPPALFRKYATNFTKELVAVIQKNGGWARIHCHGKIRNNLDALADMGGDAIDPLEPPPKQGDMTLAEVRERYGDRWTLFGNIEITDIENLPVAEFEKKVATALREGVGGKGFVMMPSASPYGRNISAKCLRNYERMIEMAEAGG